MNRTAAIVAAVAALALAACGDDGGGNPSRQQRITVVTHDSFAVSDEVLESFTAETGIEVRLAPGGDAGATLNQAILTKDDPEGDVLFGVDNTFLTRALDAGLFEPYESPELASVDDDFVLDARHRVTPVDYGDVCVNFDRAFFAAEGAPPVPATLEDLADPAYAGLLVVENPATSSPGLAFLLATVEHFGEARWAGYWQELRANDVAVADGWEDAYYSRFSGGAAGEGDRPLVVSYASSPPAEVLGIDPLPAEAPTGVMEASCFRQVEFAGVLRGTDAPEAARRFIDFLLSPAFQEDMPLNMFVFPVRGDAELPDVFERFAAVPANPLQVDAADIGAHRDEWISEWTDVVLR